VIDGLLRLIHAHLDHVLAILVVFSRLADLGTTWLASPRLRLEANPVLRRLGWPFGLASLLLGVVPYFHTGAALLVVMPSLLVSAANAGRIWTARALGEDESKALALRMARQSRFPVALASVLASAVLMALTGLVILVFHPRSSAWGFWIGLGVVTYGLVIAIHGSISTRRLFREAAVSAVLLALLPVTASAGSRRAGPEGQSAASSPYRCTADRMHFLQSPRCRLSFSEWALHGGSSTPTSRQGTPGRWSVKGCTNPIDPPAPM
jgi:hypothetical protein